MFTGLIQGQGRVAETRRKRGGMSFLVELPAGFSPPKGASIAVNGVCLTVEEVERARARVFVVDETLKRSALTSLRVGDMVNLEQALAVGERLGGHIVQGHSDTVGKIEANYSRGDARIVKISFPSEYRAYIVPNGSVAVDGVSLSVKDVSSDSFTVSLIPETLQRTTLATFTPGRRVNLEFDIIAKYVESVKKYGG